MKKLNLPILVFLLAFVSVMLAAATPARAGSSQIDSVTYGVTTKVFTDATDYTLSEDEEGAAYLVIKSEGVFGAKNIIGKAPDGRVLMVRNSTGVAITVRSSGGTKTGVTIAAGKTATIIGINGDYKRVTGDATN